MECSLEPEILQRATKTNLATELLLPINIYKSKIILLANFVRQHYHTTEPLNASWILR
jgi:hypothetical protein